MSYTGPAVTPAAVQLAQRLVQRCAPPSIPPMMASTSARCRTRSALFRNRGSSMASSRPTTLNTRSAIDCIDADIATHLPSFVAYTFRGDAVFDALPTRCLMLPSTR